MDTLTVTKRRVEVCVGCPEMLDGFPLRTPKEMPHHTECYFINFVDVQEGEEGYSGFTAQTVCLCTLALSTAAWLQGATEEEVMTVMGKHTSNDHNESTGN
jgi:hypothetical protein